MAPGFQGQPLFTFEYLRNDTNQVLVTTDEWLVLNTNRKESDIWRGLLNCTSANELEQPSSSFQQFRLKISLVYAGLRYEVQAI